MTEPYAYEVRHEDEDELVYAGWLEKYASDAYRACPRIPLYKEPPPASTNRLTVTRICEIWLEQTGVREEDVPHPIIEFALAIIAATEAK